MRMPKVKVGEKDGYTVFYDPESKHFSLNDKEGNEVAIAETQDKVEAEISKLVKQTFKLPIPAIRTSHSGVCRGRITSVNAYRGTAYFSYADKAQGTTEKVSLGYGPNIFELTPENERIISKIENLVAQREKLREEIETLKEHFEKPINNETLGS